MKTTIEMPDGLILTLAVVVDRDGKPIAEFVGSDGAEILFNFAASRNNCVELAGALARIVETMGVPVL